MAQSRLDVGALYAALDAARSERGDLSWRQLAQAAGVGPSTLSRMAQGNRPDVDSFAALVHWLGLPAEEFMRHPVARDNKKVSEPTQAAAVASLLRANKDLDPESADAISEILQAAMRLVEKRGGT